MEDSMTNNTSRSAALFQPFGVCRFLCLVSIAVFAFSGCEKKLTPEEEIRALINRGVAALEANQLSQVVELLAKEYLDSGGRDYKKMKSLAFIVLRRGPVMVFLSDVSIDVNGVSGTVQLKATAIQGQKKITALKDVIPQKARKMDLTIQVLKNGNDWEIMAMDGDRLDASF